METKVKTVRPKKTTTKKKPPSTKKSDLSFDPNFDLSIDTNDPKKIMFAAYYLNPDSPSYGKALSSAIAAGFSPSYAKNLTHLKPQWLSELMDKFRSNGLLELARKNIERDLNIKEQEPLYYQGIPAVDHNGQAIMVDNTRKMELRQKATALVLENLDPMFQKKEKDQVPGGIMNVQINFYTPDTAAKQATVDQPITIPINDTTAAE